MSTQLGEVALTTLLNEAYSDIQRARQFYLREAQSLQQHWRHPRHVSQGLRRVCYELFRLTEYLYQTCELARDRDMDRGPWYRDLEQLGLELQDDFFQLIRDEREACLASEEIWERARLYGDA